VGPTSAPRPQRPAPALLHHDLDIVQRILRDQLGDSFKAIWIDTRNLRERPAFVERFQPALVGKVKMYTGRRPSSTPLCEQRARKGPASQVC